MNRHHMFVAGFLLLAIGAFSLVRAEIAAVDPVHSGISFRIKHANAGYVMGRFNNFSGTITLDSDASKMSFEAVAHVDSIDTANAKRDTHLKSPDFFSAKEFPTIKFKSTSVKAAGDDKFEVTGDMTLHGQTKPVVLTMTKTGESESPQMGKRIGFFSVFTVKRSDFGMSGMQGAVGDEVEITVAFEAKR